MKVEDIIKIVEKLNWEIYDALGGYEDYQPHFRFETNGTYSWVTLNGTALWDEDNNHSVEDLEGFLREEYGYFRKNFIKVKL